MPPKETDTADAADTADGANAANAADGAKAAKAANTAKHTSTLCAECSSTDWTNAELTVEMDVFSLSLMVKGPEPLRIWYEFRTKEEIRQWTKRLSQSAPPIRVRIRTKSKVTDCIHQATKVAQKRVVAQKGARLRPRLSREFVLDWDMLTLDYSRGTTQVLIPVAAWRYLDALFPLNDDLTWPVLTVSHMLGVPDEEDDNFDDKSDEEEEDDEEEDVDADLCRVSQKQGEPELSALALAAGGEQLEAERSVWVEWAAATQTRQDAVQAQRARPQKQLIAGPDTRERS